MESPNEKIYVSVSRNMEGGERILKWAFNQWSSQSVSFVILHINTNTLDYVQTPFGKFPSSSLNEIMLEDYKAKENEKVDSLLRKYASLNTKVRVELLKVDASDGDVPKNIVSLIASLGIKKLVMGFKNTKTSWKAKYDNINSCYVQKHKPRYCELFIVSGGQIVLFREDNVDEGFYFIQENGTIVADFRKKSKEKGSFKMWFGKKSTDNTSRNVVSSPSCVGDDNLDAISDKWEDKEEEIERYVQSLEELELPDNTINNQLEVGDMDNIKSNKEGMLQIIQHCKSLVEQKNCDAKADEERRRKAERIIYLCNQRVDQVQANCREETAKHANLNEELNKMKSQMDIASNDLTKSKFYIEAQHEQDEELIIKLQSYSLQNLVFASEFQIAENEKVDMLQKIEDTRKQIDFMKQRIEFYEDRKVIDALNGCNYRYKEFMAEELRTATKDFSEDNMISSTVYKGRMDNKTVAVHFNPSLCDSLEKFKTQVELLSQVNHPNIQILYGACTKLMCTVLEHMENGNLHSILFSSSSNKQIILPWNTRIKIAANLLSAIGFVCASPVQLVHVHNHLDASDVFIDSNFTAKIRVLCNDIPSLGLIILQLITGNERITVQEVEVAIKEGRIVHILDGKAGEWPIAITRAFAKIGVKCCEHENDVNFVKEMIKEIGELEEKAEEQVVHERDACTEKKVVPHNFLCPILQEVMKNPHVANDGFSYELEAIKEWLNSGHETSPMTNLKMKNKLLTPNHTLQCLIRDWQRY